MRVITGSAKGRRLIAPKGNRVRPTTDRIKEALFSIIGEKINNIVFVDCFAGTGSIGIEALSRGAKKCYFIDNHPESLHIIKENLHMANLMDRAEVIPKNVVSGIKAIASDNEKADIIFLDPPYLKGFTIPAFAAIAESNILHESGWVILEHSKTEILEQEYSGLMSFRQQIYGNTVLSFYKKEENL